MGFYNNFTALCRGLGVSASAAAVNMGFTKSAVTRWKAGSIPSNESLITIANYFGVTVSDLLSEKPASLSESELDALLVAKLTALSPAEVERVEAYIDGILASRKG